MNKNKTIWVLIPAALILFPLFFYGGSDHQPVRSVKYFWDTGHIIFFTITTCLLLHYCKSLATKTLHIQFGSILFVTLLVGFSIEFIQSGINRTPDFGDLLRNIIGSLVGLFFFSSSRKLIPKSRLIPVQFLIIVLLLFEIFPIGVAVIDEWNARKKFPVLADFESPLEISRWIGDADFQIVRDETDEENYYLEVTFGTSKYSGVFLKYFPHNWKGYSALAFSIYNPSQKNLHITCRVHDMQHEKGIQLYNDRYNKTFLIKPGKNTFNLMIEDIIKAPVSRTMNSNTIEEIGIFIARPKKQIIIYLDNIMLLKENPGPQ